MGRTHRSQGPCHYDYSRQMFHGDSPPTRETSICYTMTVVSILVQDQVSPRKHSVQSYRGINSLISVPKHNFIPLSKICTCNHELSNNQIRITISTSIEDGSEQTTQCTPSWLCPAQIFGPCPTKVAFRPAFVEHPRNIYQVSTPSSEPLQR